MASVNRTGCLLPSGERSEDVYEEDDDYSIGVLVDITTIMDAFFIYANYESNKQTQVNDR